MRKWLVLLLFLPGMMLFSCAPVLNRAYMREGSRGVSFQQLRENPGKSRGTLFILGGVIVQTKLTAAGAQIEAMHVTVDSAGHFKDQGYSEGRFLAVLSGEGTMLDPEVYHRGRRITLAAQFVELRKGRIDETEYVYPVFAIQQIYLWPKVSPYYPAPSYYYDYWFYPYPFYYWGPWWQYPYYYHVPPTQQRTTPPDQPPPQSSEPQPEPL